MSMTTALLPRGRLRLLGIVVSAALLVVSCSGTTAGTTDAAPGHDLVVVGRPGSGSDEPTDGVNRPTLVTTRDDLVDERRLIPDDVWVDSSDPTLLRVRFTAGAAPCAGVRLAVDAGPATVRVVLHQGTPPEGAGQMCMAVAVTQEVRFELDRPIGSRELIWSEA